MCNRPTGYVEPPAALAQRMRAAIKVHGIARVVEACGLARVAVYAVAAETTVQARTLAAARTGLAQLERDA